MDEWGFLQTLQSSMNPVAVVFAITVCWVIKQWFFRDIGDTHGWLRPGTLGSRIFPTAPIFLATLYVIATGYKQFGINELLSRGIVSGAMAGFFYRTWKVSVRGE